MHDISTIRRLGISGATVDRTVDVDPVSAPEGEAPISGLTVLQLIRGLGKHSQTELDGSTDRTA